MEVLFGNLLCLAPAFVLPALMLIRSRPTPAGMAALAGAWWSAYCANAALRQWTSPWADAGDLALAQESLLYGILGGVPTLGWLALRGVHRREARALTQAGGVRVGEGRWRFIVGTTEVYVDLVTRGAGRRLLDRRAHAFSATLPLTEARVTRRRLLEPAPWHYNGPAHLRTIWMTGEVPSLLGTLLDRRGARVEEGVLTVTTPEWLSETTVSELLTEIGNVVGAVRDSGRDAVPQVQEEARGTPETGSRQRVDAWRILADHLPDGLAAVAPEGLADPDPVVRVIAARALGDRAAIGDVLGRTEDPEAIRRAVAAIRAGGWTELLDKVAARIGVPPEETWFDLVRLVAELGGRAEVERLAEVANAPGHTPELRAAARDAHARIRARLGNDGAGRVTLAEAEGGHLALTPEAGSLSEVPPKA